jgi:hypothetical protein
LACFLRSLLSGFPEVKRAASIPSIMFIINSPPFACLGYISEEEAIL